MRRPALSTQILAVNTVLIAATVFAAAAASHLRLDASLPERRQLLVLTAAILATVLVNGFVLRRRFAALEELASTMERVDLTHPGVRMPAPVSTDSDEIVRLHHAFNAMLGRLEEERHAAASAVLRAQEDERARLARDLHDEVNQALTGVLLRLQATAQDAPPELVEELRETQAVAAEAMDQLRRLAHDLRPTALDDHGLVAALRTLVDDFTRKTATPAVLDVNGDVDGFRPDEQLVVYRVVQEALSNVTRHADARHVRVEVRRRGARGAVRIADDGCGVDPSLAAGHGVTGMRERALHAGGTLEVRANAEGGTTVELLLGRVAPPHPLVGAGRRAWA